MPLTQPEYYEYTAREGDTWDIVSYRSYDYSERYAHLIIQANPQYIDVLTFEGGEVLRVPIIDRVESTESQPPWRR